MRELIYISGPMSGVKDHNFPAFNALASKLRSSGWRVVNPAELVGGATWVEFMRRDIRYLMDCDMVIVLPGWQKSRGALMEVAIATILKMPIVDSVENRYIRLRSLYWTLLHAYFFVLLRALI